MHISDQLHTIQILGTKRAIYINVRDQQCSLVSFFFFFFLNQLSLCLFGGLTMNLMEKRSVMLGCQFRIVLTSTPVWDPLKYIALNIDLYWAISNYSCSSQ